MVCCSLNSKFQARPIIATIGVPNEIKDRIKDDHISFYQTFFKFQDFDSITFDFFYYIKSFNV